MRPVAFLKVTRHDTGLVVDAVGVAVGLVGGVDAGEEVVGLRGLPMRPTIQGEIMSNEWYTSENPGLESSLPLRQWVGTPPMT